MASLPKAAHGSLTSFWPAMQGRVGILHVHARNKKVEEGLDYHKVARATAGFTGAELMNLMNVAAVVAVRRGAKVITQEDVFQVRHCFADFTEEHRSETRVGFQSCTSSLNSQAMHRATLSRGCMKEACMLASLLLFCLLLCTLSPSTGRAHSHQLIIDFFSTVSWRSGRA